MVRSDHNTIHTAKEYLKRNVNTAYFHLQPLLVADDILPASFSLRECRRRLGAVQRCQVMVRLYPAILLTTSAISFNTLSEVSNDTFWKAVQAYFENVVRSMNAGIYVIVTSAAQALL